MRFVGLQVWLSKAEDWCDHLHLTGVEALPELSTAQTSGSPLVNTTATMGAGMVTSPETSNEKEKSSTPRRPLVPGAEATIAYHM